MLVARGSGENTGGASLQLYSKQLKMGGSALKKRCRWGTRVSTTVHPLHGPDPFASVRFDPCGNHLSKIPAGFVPWEFCKRRASRVNYSTSCGS